MLVNWYANKSGNMVTFPIGVSVAEVIKLGPPPIRIAVQPQDMPVHPDAFDAITSAPLRARAPLALAVRCAHFCALTRCWTLPFRIKMRLLGAIEKAV
jgi:hypothetical protein